MMIDEQFFVKTFQDYRQQLPGQELTGLMAHRQQALQQLVKQTFPTRHDEDWKYSSVRGLLSHRWQWPLLRDDAQLDLQDYRLLDDSVSMVFVDGQPVAPVVLPDGLQVLSLTQALQRQPALIEPYFTQMGDFPSHAFQYLNDALMHTGFVIIVPPGVKLATPIHVLFVNQAAEQQLHLRNLIIAGPDSEVTVIEHFVGEQEQAYFTNTVTQVDCQARAQVTHVKLIQEGLQAYHVGNVVARQAKESIFNSFSFALRGGWTRSDTQITLAEPFAACQLQGLYLGQAKQHIDHHTFVHHATPHGCSKEFYKGVMTDESRAVFNGRVLVAKDAQKTDATQQNKNLLLTDKAEVDTKPQLEIYADDVTCAHGATVGQLDQQALFYLRSRGIEQMHARALLIEAFAAEIIERLPNQQLQQRLAHDLRDALGSESR
jgi:Fe-S cluster assembly protein SufD